MIDVEVMRLRRLRDRALRTRALARAMDGDAAPRHSTLSRSALACWRIARAVTGVLRAHPNLDFQREAGHLRSVYDEAGAQILAGLARYRGRTLQAFGEELHRVARELDDTRALTWSAELSDTLGRFQGQVRRLLRELDVAALAEGGSQQEAAAVLESHVTGVRPEAKAANWPYLAL